MKKIFLATFLLIVSMGLNSYADVTMAARELKLTKVADQRFQVQLCSGYQCRVIGAEAGYSLAEFKSIRAVTAAHLKQLTRTKWTLGLGLSLASAVLYKAGYVVSAVVGGSASFPQLQNLDNYIMAQEKFVGAPGALSGMKFELPPEEFNQLVEGMANAITYYEWCLSRSEDVLGKKDINYCL